MACSASLPCVLLELSSGSPLIDEAVVEVLVSSSKMPATGLLR